MDDNIGPELHTIWSEAKEHIEHGDYDKAIDIYKYVLIRYGDNDIAVEYANAYLGDIYLTLRQINLAENHIRKLFTAAQTTRVTTTSLASHTLDCTPMIGQIRLGESGGVRPYPPE
jgi:tetratricopeptide (TPR) repeat protein